MSDLTDKIRSKGFWQVAIRPATFVDERVPYGELEHLLARLQVRMRGWPVPYVDESGRRDIIRRDNWVGQDVDAEIVSMYEAWRFFPSGLLTLMRAVSADWRGGFEATWVPSEADSSIELWEILFYLTEVFELAARLALSEAGDETMVISTTLFGVSRRALVVGQPNRVEFSQPRISDAGTISREVALHRDVLAASSRTLAAETSIYFYNRFGWNPALDQVLDHQRELTEKGG